jgi:hypothetical protein
VRLLPGGKLLVTGSANNALGAARYLGDADALHASTRSAADGAATLSPALVPPLVQEALTRWQATGANLPALSGLTVRIADLGGTTLGLASGNTIWLDDDAAGWGWFVDRTPSNDSEFRRPGNQGEQGKMDLLSVLMHEVGHLLGHDHDNHGVMQETLAPGTRSLPESGDASAPALSRPPAWDAVSLALALDAELRRKR